MTMDDHDDHGMTVGGHGPWHATHATVEMDFVGYLFSE